MIDTMLHLTEKDRKTILVHTCVKDGELVNFYTGEALPKLREGAMVDLRIYEKDFQVVNELEALSTVRSEEFLSEGKRVFVCLNDARVDSEKRGRLAGLDLRRQLGREQIGAYVFLEEPVTMTLNGSKKGSLSDAKCMVPVLGDVEARSLNHAYTLLSKEFETRRRSIGGNVFENAFVQNGERWSLLRDLRNESMAKHERILMTNLGVKDVDARIKVILKQ